MSSTPGRTKQPAPFSTAKKKKRQRVCADDTAKFTNSNCVPKKLDTPLRWAEMVHSCHVPTAAFTYEVTFPQSIIKHLKLKIQLLLDSDLRYCAITEVKTFLTEVIQPGDILLSINGNTLLYQARENDPTFDSNTIGSVITAAGAQPPCVVRILRLGGMTINFRPSPVELAMFQADSKCTAEFVVNLPDKKKDVPTEATGVTADGGSSSSGNVVTGIKAPSIELRYLARDAPNCIKRMMQGMKIQWDYYGVAQNAIPLPTAAAGVAAPVLDYASSLPPAEKTAIPTFGAVAAAQSSYALQTSSLPMKDDDGLVSGGVYRQDRFKWGAYMAEKITCGGTESSTERVHNLGCKFDSEADARTYYLKANEEVRTSGYFSHTRFLRLQNKPTIPTSPALTLSLGTLSAGAQQQQQQEEQKQQLISQAVFKLHGNAPTEDSQTK